MTALLDQVLAFRPFHAIVVGDFMLDEHVYGAAERLSPDAPVPVLHASRWEHRPGGAANVSLCLHALGATVECFGVTGADASARDLRTALDAESCDAAGLIEDPSRPTTIKRSLVGLAQHRHPQKMFRLDIESKAPVDDAVIEQLLAAVAASIDRADVVCLEDYNKGVCTPALCRRLIELAREHGKPILVDPAAIEDYSKYAGATAMTPNRSEAELATDMEAPLDADDVHNAGLARRLLETLDLDAVVVTLDRHGALLEERGGGPVHVPTTARSVYDVTGAGDMVLAALAGGVANGWAWVDSVRFANIAAGLEIEMFGAQAIPLVRIQQEVMRLDRPPEGKRRTLVELLVELGVRRASQQRVILTNGCFDVIHAGHVAYLREAKSLGDVLVVGMNSDTQVRAQKGEGRPVYSTGERAEILGELQCVDYVVVFEEPTAHALIEAVRPDVYVKGGDYAPEQINEYDLVQSLGIEMRVLGHRPGLGSTEVIQRFTKAYAPDDQAE